MLYIFLEAPYRDPQYMGKDEKDVIRRSETLVSKMPFDEFRKQELDAFLGFGNPVYREFTRRN